MRHTEAEARVYWNAAKHFRLNTAAGKPSKAESDDLEAIKMHTDNAVMRKDSSRLVDAGKPWTRSAAL